MGGDFDDAPVIASEGSGEASDFGGSQGADSAPDSPARLPESGNGIPRATEPATPFRHGPPQAWAKEHHAHWDAVPEALRPYLHQRETEAQKRISELGNSAKLSDEVGKAFQHFGVQLPQGVSHGKAVAALLAAEHALKTNPQQALAYLAKHAGVDLRALAGGGQPDAALRQVSQRATMAESVVEHLQGENERLKAQLAERDEQDVRRKEDQERQVKEARRQAPFAQRSNGVGKIVPAKGTIDDSIRRNLDRLMG